MAATSNNDQSLQEALPCKLMIDWYPRTVPSASYKTEGKVWPIIGILRYGSIEKSDDDLQSHKNNTNKYKKQLNKLLNKVGMAVQKSKQTRVARITPLK